jgi:hypothetical protein
VSSLVQAKHMLSDARYALLFGFTRATSFHRGCDCAEKMAVVLGVAATYPGECSPWDGGDGHELMSGVVSSSDDDGW